MIIWSVHFHCCAMRIRAIPSPFQRHFNARQRFAFPLLTSAFLCCSIAGQCEAEQVLCFPSLTPTSPLRFCARLHASPSRFDSSQCHCQTMLRLSFLRPCVSVRGDSLLCHSFAVPCGAALRRCFAEHCLPLLRHCYTFQLFADPLRCRDTHRPAKPSLFFWFQNRTQPALCSS